MKSHSHVVFWCAVIFVAMFIVPIGLTPEAAKARVEKEHATAASIFGKDTTNKITDRANGAYDVLVNKSGLGAFMDSLYTTEQQVREVPIGQDTQRNVGGTFNRYLWSMSTQLYGLVLRLNIMFQWLMYVGIFLVAAIVDGHQQRKVKNATMQTISPVKYSLSLHTVIALLFLPIVYMVVPLHISPWFMPVWAFVVAIPLSKAIANASGFD